ncbi:MAG: GNAT family N-acetyltransferase [Clostridiales bacterium]|nr:GNAT family N-acetyltransferase [Clostridiales bacterium]
MKETNSILIRPYEQRDFERLCQIHDPAREKELALAKLPDAFVPLNIAAEREGLFDYQLYVAEYRDTVAGFVAFTEDELAWLYVDVAFSHRGIGSSLVRFALTRMTSDASIEVLSGSLPAIALYTGFGFEIYQTLTGVMPGNEAFHVTVHVMRRSPSPM